VAVATGFALWMFGVDNFAMWGILAGLFNSIPYLGPLLVTGGLALVAFMQFNDIARSVYVSGERRSRVCGSRHWTGVRGRVKRIAHAGSAIFPQSRLLDVLRLGPFFVTA